MFGVASFSSIFATLVCLVAGVGHICGFWEPNVCSDESYLAFYTILWASVAIPFRVGWGLMSLAIHLAQYRRKAV